jgi:hypothetical protein
MIVEVRPVVESDLETFYEHQTDPEATAMAVFGAQEHDAYMERWHQRILANPDNYARTITVDGAVAGNLLSWSMEGTRYVGYWIGREFWGRGVATAGMRALLEEIQERWSWSPTSARSACSRRAVSRGSNGGPLRRTDSTSTYTASTEKLAAQLRVESAGGVAQRA